MDTIQPSTKTSARASPTQIFELDVALGLSISKSFKYLSHTDVPQGARVLVPFGSQHLQGICLACSPYRPKNEAAESDLHRQKRAKARSYELKYIKEQVDETPFFTATLLQLAQWLSTYYCHPLGDVLKSMAPSSQHKHQTKKWIRTSQAPEEVVLAFAGRTSLSHATLSKKINSDQIQLWQKSDWIKLEKARKTIARRSVTSVTTPLTLKQVNTSDKKSLTQDQQKVIDGIWNAPLSQPQLLHGVTGAGKTEVYMQLIERCRQALVMVPEISLTPQMTQVFQKRFGSHVEVVHSGMTAHQRFQALERVRSKTTRILIGPRSAVFAPFTELDLIIVDEEHDTSYKQSTGFCYHGRDVAIVRAKFDKARIVLGSATPSMESILNANIGKYGYHELKQAVFHQTPPQLKIVSSPQKLAQKLEPSFINSQVIGSQPLLHDDIVEELKQTLLRNEQAMVLINRRGHSYYVMSAKNKKSVQCPHCSVSLSVHGNKKWLHCHYCEYSKNVDELLRENDGDDIFFAVGHGSEQMEIHLKSILCNANIARLDADILENKEALDQILGDFRAKKIDVLVGTQILAKGHDFPDVTMVAILDADEMLQLPDFRASERCFQLIVQAAGRVGRAGKASTIMVQTLQHAHPVIHAACTKDYASFMHRELNFRQEAAFPPYIKLAKIEIKGEDPSKLSHFCKVFQDWLEVVARDHPDLPSRIKLYGPTSPPLEVIRNQHRRVVLLKARESSSLRILIRLFQDAFTSWEKKLKIHIDIDPQSLM